MFVKKSMILKWMKIKIYQSRAIWKLFKLGGENWISCKTGILAENNGKFAIFHWFYNEINKFLILSAKLMQGFKGWTKYMKRTSKFARFFG